ncbi:hypothetical protein [uncultured Brevundimonas sp.]|uniref:hypothetical protein n=1 Tax=uncultured Brevundimonas sp. TaxID=213418 RepID=UPI0030EF79D9|tara:strand:+ start:19621 stop:19989 length:369 start_codon:yes stop_codon:yes gene_type:complete
MSSLIEKLLARAADVKTAEVDADGITVRVREPSAAAHALFHGLNKQGRGDEAMAHLLRACVIDADGVPCLTDEQAKALSTGPSELVVPIAGAILEFVQRQKNADAPGADAVPDQPAAGAAAE